MAKTIAVIGATGIQGFSVVRTLLARKAWKIRAITRTKDSKVARDLQDQGVETVEGDLDNVDFLKQAFSGCTAIFAVTDFFVPFAANGANASEAIALETQRGNNIVDAVSATASVEHFFWSTLPHAGRITEGKVHPAHFVAKTRVDERIKSNPDLPKKTTFLWVGWYATNFLYPFFAPTYFGAAGKHIQLGPVHPDVPIAWIGDPRANIGLFVSAILQQPEKTLNGRFVLAATEMASMNKVLALWSEITGKEAQFVQCSMQDFESLWPGWGKVEGDMLTLYNDFGSQIAGSEKDVLTGADLDVDLSHAVSVVESMRAAVKNPA